MIEALRSDFIPLASCRGCGTAAGSFSEVFRMAPMPLAGEFSPTAADARKAARYPLTWVQCNRCRLVQVKENIPDEVLFSHYNYASSSVGSLVRHFEKYAALLASEYGEQEKITILEIGCNDGVLLNQLPVSWARYGCDPSDVARRAARENEGNYTLADRPFSLQTVVDNRWEGRFDLISGSNCLAHISDLAEIFAAAWRALRPGGHFWVEVHDLDALLGTRQWDTVYHEHKVEWSADSLRRCTSLAGFIRRRVDRIPIHGGSLRCCFEKQSPRVAGNGLPAERPATPFHELQRAYDLRYETEAARSLARVVGKGGRIAAYGASGRANVYLNQLSELPFSYIVDEAALRSGKHIPCVAVPIVPPQFLLTDPVEICLITAWNYQEAIIQKNAAFTGEWVTAFSDSCVSAS